MDSESTFESDRIQHFLKSEIRQILKSPITTDLYFTYLEIFCLDPPARLQLFS